MARKRKGLDLHGWLNIDKPAGMSSAACVAAAKRLTRAKKVGHAGTLDPLATGVLPIACGEATKTTAFIQNRRKGYRFTVRWGEATATDDREGDIVARSSRRPDRAAIEAILPEFHGTVSQVPPAFSALKIDGQRAYKLARRGAPLDLAPRQIEIHSLALRGIEDADQASFDLACGKGTYVRSLARDMGVRLGTRAHLADLVRTVVGPFAIDDAISLEKLEEFGHIAATSKVILPIETVLADIPALALSAEEASRLRHGQAIPVLKPNDRAMLCTLGDDDMALAKLDEQPVALVKAAGIQVMPVRVFNI